MLHTEAGHENSADSWFENPLSEVSAHFSVSLQGVVRQHVRTSDEAWANGILEPGNHWPGTPGVNPNYETISIETEDYGNNYQPVSDAQYEQVLALVMMLRASWPTLHYLVTHGTISPQTRPNCPGHRWIDSGAFGRLAAATGLVPLQ